MLKYLCLVYILLISLLFAEDKPKIEKLVSAYEISDGIHMIRDKEGNIIYFYKKGEKFLFSEPTKVEKKNKNINEK